MKGTTCFRSFSIGNDLFTNIFTAQMGRGKIHWGVRYLTMECFFKTFAMAAAAYLRSLQAEVEGEDADEPAAALHERLALVHLHVVACDTFVTSSVAGHTSQHANHVREEEKAAEQLAGSGEEGLTDDDVLNVDAAPSPCVIETLGRALIPPEHVYSQVRRAPLQQENDMEAHAGEERSGSAVERSASASASVQAPPPASSAPAPAVAAREGEAREGEASNGGDKEKGIDRWMACGKCRAAQKALAYCVAAGHAQQPRFEEEDGEGKVNDGSGDADGGGGEGSSVSELLGRQVHKFFKHHGWFEVCVRKPLACLWCAPACVAHYLPGT